MEGLDFLLGADAIGATDIATLQRQMNTLKTVNIGTARALLKEGQATINQARATAVAKGLPGGGARDDTYWKLDWHQKQLALIADPTAPYPYGDDLKKWIVQAFVEANAVDEGAAYVQQNWDDMWTDIGTNIVNLPAAARKGLVGAAGWLVPWYVWVGGAGVIGIAGLVAYKLLMASVPAVSSAVVKRYLP